MANNDINTDTNVRKPLRYHETIEPFMDVVGQYFFEEDLYVYRTVVNNPPSEYDITPQRRRNHDSQGPILTFQYTKEDVEEMTEKEIKEEIGHNAISVHQTEDMEIKEAKRAYKSFSKKHTAEESEAYKFRRGTYVARFHITKDNALISKFDNGKKHANVLLREGVTVEDLIDKTYPIKPFSYEDEDKK